MIDVKENIKWFKNMAITHKANSNAYTISIANKKSLEFIQEIYKDHHICLDRKFNKIIAVCDEKYPSISQIIRTE